jgi:hypothetical protein
MLCILFYPADIKTFMAIVYIMSMLQRANIIRDVLSLISGFRHEVDENCALKGY